MSSPRRPSEDEAEAADRDEQQASDQVADLRHARQPWRRDAQAAIADGLFSFGLLPATRRNWADNPARKPSAAMHRVICRCQPVARRKTLSHYLTKIARLGGYLARAADPPPGNAAMWRGLARLRDIEPGANIQANYGCNRKQDRTHTVRRWPSLQQNPRLSRAPGVL